jgi:hypothetical protein
MEHKKENVMGMELEIWSNKSCQAQIGTGDDWATLYLIESGDKGKGHAQELIIEARKHYEGLGLRFGGSVALNSTMKHIYKKLNILEYE